MTFLSYSLTEESLTIARTKGALRGKILAHTSIKRKGAKNTNFAK